jgi:hypothetical protein
MDLVVSIGGGKPGPKEWVLFIGDPGDVPVAVGTAAVVAPQLYPYYPNQVVGILGGIKGAAEYESELVHKSRFSLDAGGRRIRYEALILHHNGRCCSAFCPELDFQGHGS